MFSALKLLRDYLVVIGLIYTGCILQANFPFNTANVVIDMLVVV